MAKRRRKAKAVKRATPKKATRKRKRMGAGGNKMFKAVSNPIVGGIVGGAIAILVKNLAKKFTKSENDLLISGIPIVLGFMLMKKAPFLSAGMIAVPALQLIGKKVPMLAEDNSVSWANLNLLSDNNDMDEDFLLSDNNPLLLAEQGYGLNDYAGSVYGGMSDDNEGDTDF